MKKTLIVFAVLCSVSAYAAMTQIVVVIGAGEKANIVESVPWPAQSAWARLDPPARVNGNETAWVSFQADSTVVVEGPTTATIEYGTPDPVSTPDAIQ